MNAIFFRYFWIASSLLISGFVTVDAMADPVQMGVTNLSSPQGIATDGTYLYVADTGSNTIRKVLMSTGASEVVAGTREASADDGIGASAGFRRPQGITTDGVNLYVADTYNNTIRKIVLATGLVTTLAGTPGVAGHWDDVGEKASFYNPRGITTDSTNVYVADSRNNVIRKIVIATRVVTTLAGSAGRAGNDDGIGIMASFNDPGGITTADDGNLYVTDTANNMIRKIVISTGEVTTLAGKAWTFGQNDGPGAGASFTGPFGITTDGTYLYVADTFNNAIRRVDVVSGLVTTVASNATNASLSKPAGVVASRLRLYILDTNNNVIKVVKQISKQ
jgi:sugar lactone lactonase YvrE